jgi:hypothetical protein
MTTTVHSIVGHAHATSDVTGLDAALGAKASTASVPIVKTMATDQSRTSNTALANVTDLVFAIGASEEWVYEFTIRAGDAMKSTTGMKIAAALPAGATGTMSIHQERDPSYANDGNTSASVESTTTPATGIDFDIGYPKPAFDTVLMRVYLRVLNSTNAGNVQLQFAQSTSDPTALTFKAGSYGIGFKK